MKKLKYGVIGCGGIAMQKHLPALKILSEDVEVLAFCDLIPERAEKACETFGVKGAKTFTDYKELLKLDLDCICVCTPNISHCEISVASLKAGKNVICEKPMAMNYAEAKQMIDAKNESGKILTIGYQNRYKKNYIYLREEVENGTFGDIYFAKAHAIRRRAVPTWGVFLDKEKQGGGPLIDIGTHALDVTLFMMNNYEPAYVSGTTFHKLNNDTKTGNAWGDWDPAKFTVEDSAFGYIHMKNGACIFLESSWALNSTDVKEASTTLCGTKAGAAVCGDKLEINGVKNGIPYIENPTFDGAGVAFFSGDSGFKEEVSEAEIFIKAVRGEGELYVTPEQAAVVTMILEGIYESSKSGKPYFFN